MCGRRGNGICTEDLPAVVNPRKPTDSVCSWPSTEGVTDPQGVGARTWSADLTARTRSSVLACADGSRLAGIRASAARGAVTDQHAGGKSPHTTSAVWFGRSRNEMSRRPPRRDGTGEIYSYPWRQASNAEEVSRGQARDITRFR
jgi:hypothetical protein